VSVTIAGVEFDNVAYYAAGDVLYLVHGPDRAGADSDASPEGHYLRFDADGALMGITIVHARWILEREGKLTITLRERRIETSDLGDALALA
jgi:uncharacterized protein YuzE